MPSQPIVHALSSLLPSITQPPPRLISLSESLLALSRQRANHLKPDEEIARAYACCEIACDRLRAQLRLPPTKKGGAPAKPQVYRRLLGFLEGALGDATAGVGTPKRKRGGEDGEGGVEIMETPRSAKRRAVEVTPTKLSSRRNGDFLGTIKRSAQGKEGQGEAPEYIMPAIRKLCRAFRTPEMAPHVYTGTCIVLKLAELWPQEDVGQSSEAEMTSLLVALYLMVLTRMQRGKMTTKIFRGVSSKAVEIFDAISSAQEIENWIKRVNSEGYCKGQDWWDSVPEDIFDFSLHNLEATEETDDNGVLEEAEAADVDDAEELAVSRRKHIDLDQDDPEGVLLPGLGTMMSEAVDWLSDERKEAYQSWKRDILKQLAAVAA